MVSLLVTIREGTWIACTAAKVLMTLAFDRLCRVFAHSDIPLSVAALNTPETMRAAFVCTSYCSSGKSNQFLKMAICKASHSRFS